MLEECLLSGKLKKEDIYSVEIVGGSSRIPSIKEKIEKVFGKVGTRDSRSHFVNSFDVSFTFSGSQHDAKRRRGCFARVRPAVRHS